MQKDIINFSTNWNNKLDCMAFTTIRLKNSAKYQIGKKYEIHLKNTLKKRARIEDIKTIYFDQINQYIAYIDTGYSLEEVKKILIKMYPKINVQTQPFYFILLKSLPKK